MKEQAEIKLNDWHCVCNHILKCRLYIPIMFIIGDIEGHDKICSRKGSHNKLMGGVTPLMLKSGDMNAGIQVSNVFHYQHWK